VPGTSRQVCFLLFTQANGPSAHPSLSRDGQLVAFESSATNLTPDDLNDHTDVFLFNRLAHETTLVSLSSTGSQGDGDSINPSISEGRVAFESFADNLVPDDTNGASDIFVHSPLDNRTLRVSVASDGSQGNSFSALPALACDPALASTRRLNADIITPIPPLGCDIAFASDATNLVNNDFNGDRDIFVRSE
jgi:hypothetical protein